MRTDWTIRYYDWLRAFWNPHIPSVDFTQHTTLPCHIFIFILLLNKESLFFLLCNYSINMHYLSIFPVFLMHGNCIIWLLYQKSVLHYIVLSIFDKTSIRELSNFQSNVNGFYFVRKHLLRRVVGRAKEIQQVDLDTCVKQSLWLSDCNNGE